MSRCAPSSSARAGCARWNRAGKPLPDRPCVDTLAPPMSFFQLDPASIAARARAAGTPRIPSLGRSLLIGIVGFTVVSVAGFIPWAHFGDLLGPLVGERGVYVVCALVFIALSGPALHRLIIGPGSLTRFYQVFSSAFVVYAA